MSKRRAKDRRMSEIIEVKSKLDAEFRRFSLNRTTDLTCEDFLSLIGKIHILNGIPFNLCYIDPKDGDILPINNDINFHKAIEVTKVVLKLLVNRTDRATTIPASQHNKVQLRHHKANLKSKQQLPISFLGDFRRVSAIIDVDILPETHRRVRLIKNGSDRPLGFYIKDGMSQRQNPSGKIEKVPSVFISRLVDGGLAQSTGLLAVNDEVVEVNGIDISGKTLDQVTDMMVANSSNLIITVIPANQRLSLPSRRGIGYHESGAKSHEDLYRAGLAVSRVGSKGDNSLTSSSWRENNKNKLAPSMPTSEKLSRGKNKIITRPSYEGDDGNISSTDEDEDIIGDYTTTNVPSSVPHQSHHSKKTDTKTFSKSDDNGKLPIITSSFSSVETDETTPTNDQPPLPLNSESSSKPDAVPYSSRTNKVSDVPQSSIPHGAMFPSSSENKPLTLDEINLHQNATVKSDISSSSKQNDQDVPPLLPGRSPPTTNRNVFPGNFDVSSSSEIKQRSNTQPVINVNEALLPSQQFSFHPQYIGDPRTCYSFREPSPRLMGTSFQGVGRGIVGGIDRRSDRGDGRAFIMTGNAANRGSGINSIHPQRNDDGAVSSSLIDTASAGLVRIKLGRHSLRVNKTTTPASSQNVAGGYDGRPPIIRARGPILSLRNDGVVGENQRKQQQSQYPPLLSIPPPSSRPRHHQTNHEDGFGEGAIRRNGNNNDIVMMNQQQGSMKQSMMQQQQQKQLGSEILLSNSSAPSTTRDHISSSSFQQKHSNGQPTVVTAIVSSTSSRPMDQQNMPPSSNFAPPSSHHIIDYHNNIQKVHHQPVPTFPSSQYIDSNIDGNKIISSNGNDDDDSSSHNILKISVNDYDDDENGDEQKKRQQQRIHEDHRYFLNDTTVIAKGGNQSKSIVGNNNYPGHDTSTNF